MNKTSETEKAFVALIAEHQRIIYKVCYMYTTDEYTLEELYQETVINLWRAFEKFRGDSKVSTWIYRIAMNTCISYLRKSSTAPSTIPISFDLKENMAQDDNRNIYLERLYRLISRLSKLERALILLWLEEKSYKEIAEIMGFTQTNVAVRLKRVKEKLKKMSHS